MPRSHSPSCLFQPASGAGPGARARAWRGSGAGQTPSLGWQESSSCWDALSPIECNACSESGNDWERLNIFKYVSFVDATVEWEHRITGLLVAAAARKWYSEDTDTGWLHIEIPQEIMLFRTLHSFCFSRFDFPSTQICSWLHRCAFLQDHEQEAGVRLGIDMYQLWPRRCWKMNDRFRVSWPVTTFWPEHWNCCKVQLEEDLERVPEAPAEQRYARDAEEA